MYKVGIIGAAGYTGGELIRLLLQHPQVEIAYVHSNSQAGKPVSDTHDDLVGDTDLDFTDKLDLSVDVLFLCMGHGEAKKWLEQNPIPESILLIDLSHDFRWKEGFVYGLPELNKNQIQQNKRIANPGCFATAIQLALLPLAKAQLLQDEVHIHAITGSTGAGQSLQATSHFSWRNSNISVYKAFEHQHLAEIGQSLKTLQPNLNKALNFIPVRGDFTRGIFASLYINCNLGEKELNGLYHDFYQDAPFTKLTHQNPHLKQVVNTNKCIVHVEKHRDKAFIISAIDNLLKGASGQAVENMNLALGIDQCAGLQLKANAF
ncbi:MAG: N-acetyl-gamma-glutamyl-phosphate reductase [Saprospiraceae bacterium]|nr:N-acetyl-gamma-glutamyl-phosphate reductase [Saprospiraceae bacterium]